MVHTAVPVSYQVNNVPAYHVLSMSDGGGILVWKIF